MRAVDLLEYAIALKPESVLDIAVGHGNHAIAFLSSGISVTGIDLTKAKISHSQYVHYNCPYEDADLGVQTFDMVWSCHTLEHVANVQHFLAHLRAWLKWDGYLAIAVPTNRQNRLHIGHLTLWTPAHLIYNLVCAGWDCKKAKWYTSANSIGLIVQKTDDVDVTGRTGLPSEAAWFNKYTPMTINHCDAAWLPNNWHENVSCRLKDPPHVIVGGTKTNLEPDKYRPDSARIENE